MPGHPLFSKVYSLRAVGEYITVTIPPITMPGIYLCPSCLFPSGKLDDLETVRTQFDAGGHLYWWTSFVGHIRCNLCDHTWSENFS